MAQLLRDQLDDARARGESRTRVLGQALWDAVVNGLGPRLDGGSTKLGEGTMAWMGALRQDLWYSVRQIRRRPTFSVAVVVVLALGIGANTAVFSVVDALLIQAVPLPNSERLVRVSPVVPNYGIAGANLPGVQDWRREMGPFESLGGFHATVHSLTRGATPERVIIGSTVGDVFGTAGLTASLGRLYPPTDPGASPEAVLLLTDDFWRRSFGADPGVVGETVVLDGRSARIVGVLPPEERFLRFSRDIDAWAPMDAPLPWMGRGTGFLTVLGRLRSGLTPETAQQPLLALANGLIEAGDTENGIAIEPLKDALIGGARPLLWALQGAALLLMFVVAMNAANLLLARSLDRTGEFAVRAALGAGRGRITRQVLAETTLLALVGGVGGLGLALLGRRVVLSLIPELAALVGSTTLSWTVLTFTFGTAVGTGILAGLWPAMRAATHSWSSMKTGIGRRASGGAQRGRRALVALEVGLALVLVVGAGLMMRTVTILMDEEVGFDPENVLTARITLSDTQYPEWALRHRFWDDVVERVQQLPGVVAVGLTSSLPLDQPPDGGTFQIEGREWDSGEGPSIDKNTASPGYFEAMGIPLIEGRTFRRQDDGEAPPVAVVSESLARRFFANESAVGRKIRVGWWGDDFVEIVGVVGDVKQRGLDQGTEIAAYLSHTQTGAPGATLVVRAAGEPFALTAAVRSVVRELDQGQPIYGVSTMSDVVTGSLARPTLLASLLLGLSVIALVISCLGVYAVTAQAVRGRIQETGIRMALGASRASVLRSVILTEGRVIAIGMLLGLGAAMAVTRTLETMLFGITALDPLTLVVSVATLGAVAFLAVLGPALRAARIGPAEVLGARR